MPVEAGVERSGVVRTVWLQRWYCTRCGVVAHDCQSLGSKGHSILTGEEIRTNPALLSEMLEHGPVEFATLREGIWKTVVETVG